MLTSSSGTNYALNEHEDDDPYAIPSAIMPLKAILKVW